MGYGGDMRDWREEKRRKMVNFIEAGIGTDGEDGDRVTQSIESYVSRTIERGDPFAIIREDNAVIDEHINRTVREALAAMSGPIEVGDYVKTLHFARALYGKVTGKSKKGRLHIAGRQQPGAPLQRVANVDPENLEPHFKAGTLPEDLRGHYE